MADTRGLTCPFCKGDSEVLNVRHRDGQTTRYRRCLWNKKHRWTTLERLSFPHVDTRSNDKHVS